MSLSEETLSAKASLQMPFTSCQSAIKSLDQIRQDLADQTAEYFKKGGKIEVLSPAGNVIPDDTVKTDLTWEKDATMEKSRKRAQRAIESRISGNTPISFMDGKNRARAKALSGYQNIREKKTMEGIRYDVIIGIHNYGRFEHVKDAIAKRDAKREILGMEKAFY